MKGFLQKMAYTVQCIIMYGLFLATGYVVGQDKVQSAAAQGAISAMMYIIPPALIIISLIIFSKKYKIYGEYKTEVLNFINEKRESEHK
jgi:Na+/melibiose symporter-like transporter